MIREKQSDQEYCRLFRAARVFKPEDIPAADPRLLDVALLDMNHNWPNLGHDSFVAAVDSAVEELEPSLDSMGISVRMISYDVRKSLMVPEHPGDRFLLYLGTGGPGHLDPRLNDGASEGSQGIREDASWEKPLFNLFDAIVRNPHAALLAVCHTFGVLCRWSGVAKAVLRGAEKGGKSVGVRENVVTRHSSFCTIASCPPDRRAIK